MSGETNKKENRSSLFIIATIAIIIISVAVLYGLYQPYGINMAFKHSGSKAEPTSIKILVVGDMMLDRNVRNLINQMGFEKFFAGVKDLVRNADVAVANLEGAFTPYPSFTSDLKTKVLQFTFDPALAPALADLGFDVLGLANNHSWNYGREGLEMTRRYIGGSGMLYYGDPNNSTELSTVITKNGITVGFVGFHEFHYINFDKIFLEIARIRPLVDVLIVSPHWGIEYDKKPTEKMVQWAHQFIDDGADAVIGTHSHIVGDTEIYKGKKIYYSLGNFAFDQYFSKATMEGLGLVIKVDKNLNEIDLHYQEVPIKTDREGTRVSATTNP